MRKAKKCRHMSVEPWQANGRTMAFRCILCDAVGVLSLGPASDADLNVEREIRAAMLISSAESGEDPMRMSNAEADGYYAKELSPFRLIPAWHIGYLVRAAVDDDGTGYEWTANLPLAAQGPVMSQFGERLDDVLAARHAEVTAFDNANPICADCEAPFGCEPGRCVKQPTEQAAADLFDDDVLPGFTLADAETQQRIAPVMAELADPESALSKAMLDDGDLDVLPDKEAR